MSRWAATTCTYRVTNGLTRGATETGHGWVCTICPSTGRGRVFSPNLQAALNHERTAHDREPCVAESVKGADGTGGTRIPENDHWDKIGHLPLTSEGLRQWEMHAHVDHVFDLVPFWQRGMDAAEKGEVLRLEEFLEKMEGDGGWRTTNEVLGMLGEWRASPSEQRVLDQPYRNDWGTRQHGTWGSNGIDWGAGRGGGWDMSCTRVASDTTESSRGRDSGWGIQEGWAEGGSDLKTGRGSAGAVRGGWAARTRVKTVQSVRRNEQREDLHEFVDAIARQEAVNEERRRQMHLFFEMSMEQQLEEIEKTIAFLRTHCGAT